MPVNIIETLDNQKNKSESKFANPKKEKRGELLQRPSPANLKARSYAKTQKQKAFEPFG